MAPGSSSRAGLRRWGGKVGEGERWWDCLQHLQHGTEGVQESLCYAKEGRCTARRRWQGLAAALVAKGAAETVEGVCRKSLIYERIGDAGTGHARKPAAFPSTFWHKLRYEGTDEQCYSAGRLEASAQPNCQWSWRGTIKQRTQ